MFPFCDVKPKECNTDNSCHIDQNEMKAASITSLRLLRE